MSQFTSRIRLKQATYTNVKDAFRNEDGAIDLASIMVGIIVIGLIGGVIAATVFAVIPWTQDNAAKHQLESIHNAQNAYMGLVSDPSRNLLAGEKNNSFTNSAGLETAGLLATGDTYCTVPSADGKDYTAYSKSSSGTIFVSMNSDKKAAPFTGTLADDCSFLLENGETETVMLEPPAPTGPVASEGYKILDSWDFEADRAGVTPADWVYNTGYGYTYTGATSGYNDTKSMYASNQTNSSVAVFRNGKYNFKAGVTYKLTAWTKVSLTSASSASLRVTATNGVQTGGSVTTLTNGTWKQVSLTFTGQGYSNLYITSAVPLGAKVTMFMDDIVIEEKLP